MEVVHGIGGVVDLTENLIRAFKDPNLFEADENGDFWAYDTELEFPIDDVLITGGGRCNWEAMSYVQKNGDFRIYAGDRDSFGWLTGVIEPITRPEWTNGKRARIVYG